MMREREGREGSAKKNKCHKSVPGCYNDFKKKGKNGELVCGRREIKTGSK